MSADSLLLMRMHLQIEFNIDMLAVVSGEHFEHVDQASSLIFGCCPQSELKEWRNAKK